MKVIDLMYRASPSEVARLYTKYYRDDGWNTVESFNEFRVRLGNEVGIREGDDQFKAIIEWVDQKWTGRNGKEYHDQYFSVGGRKVNDPEQVWSLSMTDWGVWKEMEVEDETGKNLSIDELATHIYYEMTWFGWPESMEDRRDLLNDRMESFERAFANYKEGDPLPEGFIELTPENIDKLFKDTDDGDDN